MNLLHISNTELEKRLLHFVAQERKLLHIVLLHTKEIETRKLYLEKSRSSLYEYLTKDVGYSSSAAQRRIEGARLLKEIPELSNQLEDGKINLSQVCEIARAVKQSDEKISRDQKLSLLKSIECKTTSETQLIVAHTLDLELKALEVKRIQKDESVRLEITLSKEQYEKLLKCRDLESHTLLNRKNREQYGLQHSAGLELSDVIELLCEQKLKSIAASATRRAKKLEEPKPEICEPTNKLKIASKLRRSKSQPEVERKRKGITSKIRKEVIQKLKVCQYRDSLSQKICGSSFLLQIDHLTPQWAGGSHEGENLTLLCANHNRLKYQKETHLKLR